MIPGWFWLYDHGHYRKGSPLQRLYYWLHWGMILLGAFFLVGATYGVVLEIKEAYANGTIGRRPAIRHIVDDYWLTKWLGSAFSCADNSNSS